MFIIIICPFRKFALYLKGKKAGIVNYWLEAKFLSLSE